eukprot:3275425-Prymnesium_polylepis.1
MTVEASPSTVQGHSAARCARLAPRARGDGAARGSVPGSGRAGVSQDSHARHAASRFGCYISWIKMIA